MRNATERERVAAILSQEQFGSRRAFARRICREFSFFDAAVDRTPRLLPSGVAEPVNVPPHPSQIRGLSISAVASASDRALWNTLIARKHPRGLATFAGNQFDLDTECTCIFQLVKPI